MIVLDTNVVSELIRPRPAAQVVGWLDGQPPGDLHLAAITVAELLFGIARLPEGRRRAVLAEQVEGMIDGDLDHRVLAFDEIAAGHYADIAARRERSGRPISIADAQIAAICRSHRAVLATRNGRDFEQTAVIAVDPWTAGTS